MFASRDIVFCFIFIVFIHYSVGVYASSYLRCEMKCVYDAKTDSELFYCDHDCQTRLCKDGCFLSPHARSNDTCQSLCSDYVLNATEPGLTASSISTKMIQSCVQGCREGLGIFYYDTVSYAGLDLPAPEVVRENITQTSVELEWYGDRRVDQFGFVLQLRLLDTNTEWQIHNDTEYIHPGRIIVSNLQPYVTYEFKLIYKITSIHYVKTNRTNAVMTLPDGAPSLPPTIISLVAPSPTVVSISWTPPLFTNGPVLSYRLTIHPVSDMDHVTSTDVLPHNTSWIFGHLLAGMEYVVTIAAVNKDGEGPADVMHVTTPTPGNLSEKEMPYLILGAENMVVKQRLMELTREADKILEKPKTVRIIGVGVHVERELILVSDSSGRVTLINVSGDTENDDVYPMLSDPSAIDVDWLNNHAYVVDGYRIYRCPIRLSGGRCQVALDNAPFRLREVKVDPINGYLYYTLMESEKGLYRVDMAELDGNSIPSPRLLIETDLHTFFIEYDNLRLYFPNNTQNTIMAMYLDGTGVTDIRKGTVARPHFTNIDSMISFEDKFFWTNGTKVFSEEYDSGNRTYYHNTLLLFEKHFCAFNMYYKHAQPIPIPFNPPSQLQVLFSTYKATIEWQAPATIIYQGRGAFNKWDYEVKIQQDDGSQDTVHETSRHMQLTVSNLEPDTQYRVAVRAKSKTGTGPWSPEFIGQTLPEGMESARLVVAVQQPYNLWHLIETDLDGTSPILIKETSPVHPGITDLEWYGNMYLWTTESADMFMYREGDVKTIQLMKEDNTQAVCLAYDWLGNKIYWSDKVSREIKRTELSGNMDNKNKEVVYQSYARDMVIDSLNGRLYWVTITEVETANLNGNNHAVYFSLPEFTGVNVISLSIDHDQQKLLWYVKGFRDESLYIADLYYTGREDVLNSAQLVATFTDIDKFSPLQYFSNRLIWLSNSFSVTIGDMTCNHTSILSDIEEPVSTFSVKHESLHKYPAGLNEDTVKVIPDAISPESIQCQGNWDHFNVTWQPSIEVNHGTVSYELSIKTDQFDYPLMVIKENWFELKGLEPYVPVTVSVRGFTYWGFGPVTKTTIKSPMAAPSQPQDPRVYVTQRKNAASSKLTLAADFRWSEPEFINGVLSEQHVSFWDSSDPGMISATTVSASARHYIKEDLKANTTYFFQVESCTPVACGEWSTVANGTADAVNPVPKLLIATKDAVVLAEADTVLNKTIATIATVAKKAVKAMSYLSQDDTYYWLTMDNFLEKYKHESAAKLLQLEGEGRSLTLDWVSRTLYVCVNSETNSSIISYMLDKPAHDTLIVRQNTMGDVIVDPYTSTLLWSEKGSSDSHWTLMRSKTDGSSVKKHFLESSHHRTRRALPTRCTCPSNIVMSAGTMTMDLSHDGNTEVIFVDENRMALMATDVDGCMCRTLMKTTADDRQGLPADHLTVDHVFIYWYNKASGQLYSLDKTTHKVTQVSETKLSDILAFGKHLHPLPASECLDLDPYTDQVNVTSFSNVSITARINDITWPKSCENISHPAIKYTLYFMKRDIQNPFDNCRPAGHQCKFKTSYSRVITLDGLDPYTDYILQGAISNYYTEYSVTSLGEPTYVQTKPGVPAPVANLTATTYTPDVIEVIWKPPYPANGDLSKLVYNVKWSTQAPDGITQVSASNNITNDERDEMQENFHAHLEHLTPDQTYTIQVMCYQPVGGYSSESAPVIAHTYEKPSDLKVVDVTNTSIKLSWQSPSDNSAIRFSLHYTKLSDLGQGPELMDGIQVFTDNNTVYNESFSNLKPNTDYAFGLNIMYRPYLKVYRWPPGNDRFIFKTLTGIPGEPDPPMVKDIVTGEFEISWLEPEDNGEIITHYMLEYKLIDRDNWTYLCNTSEQRWVVSDTILQRGYTYMFRVSAENINGWGPYSINSSLFSYPIIEMEQEDGYLTVIVVVCALVFIIIGLASAAFCMVWRKQKEERKKKHSQFLAVSRGPDLELATLRELPITAVQQSNALYAMNLVPTDDDIAALPHFRRDQLVLCKFLGSGAFGEVFEGIAKNILNESSGDTRCAVKTLRKSASELEKDEFLKEALLMSNFKHEHILSLLGVCLDNDPQFIILELMEGGDLLSFMRACRLSSIQNRAELSLTDLVKICVHVSRGCKYLEDMHFVHRDLAARNCLVSSCNPANMVIKIGDFGLARDIYKNDYYRKEGEGLLPVRWMSPESLVDGVFTTQSDIWAFGVMMWEVVTFGQQPYPARTNIEVLHYVRSGGRLDRPDNCPDDFYQLMCKCWSFAPEDRPAFAYLLQQLEKFQETCASISEYLVPIRSNNGPITAVDGYKYLKPRSRRLTSTSSDGPEYRSIHHSSYGSHKSYGQIRRATSFDAPEPKDATQQIQTDSSNYLEPKSCCSPAPYVEFLPDSRTENYMYNSKGERIRDQSKSQSLPRGPFYVQTTVKENFNMNSGPEYIKYIQKSKSIPADVEDTYRKIKHQQNSADSVIMKTVENIPGACNINDVHMSVNNKVSNIANSEKNLPTSENMNGHYAQILPGPTRKSSQFRKQRLDSNNSTFSFDSVQTEPAYSDYNNQRNKLYSSSSSKSNYSMSNISETISEHITEKDCSHMKQGEEPQYWANSSIPASNNKLSQDSKNSVDYFNISQRSQVYPESAGVLAGYDIVQSSLV